MQSLTEKYIFISRDKDEVSNVFSRKVVSFHEIYSESLLLSGLGSEEESMEDLKMSKSPDFPDQYFSDLIDGLKSVEPLLISSLIHDEKMEAYLSVFYLPFLEIEGFFLLQQISNWGGSKNTSYQVWALSEDCNLYQMIDHWDFLV